MKKMDLSRRRFLTRSAAAVSGLAIGAGLAQIGYAENLAARKMILENYKPTFFNHLEWRCLVACCDCLIPADENGPGALDSLVPVYIDKQMQTEYATGGLWYMQGPFYTDSAPEFGYQHKFTPRDIYRLGFADLMAHCRSLHNKHFDEIKTEQRVEIIKGLESGSLNLASIPTAIFFKQLLINTKEGFLADPMYGGNKDMAGWKMIGFPGARGDYLEFVTRHNEAYSQAPISIEEQEG